MEFTNKRIVAAMGYSFAFAALCGMALFPQAAIADDEALGDTSSSAAASASADKSAYGAPVADEKSETVYIFTKPDGSVKETEVSTTLKNPAGEGSLADSSVLTDIENTEGPNTYSGTGDGMVWDTAGTDVYYTGKTDKKAPVSVKVTYFLDGKEVQYDKLAGASGKLKIRYDYENNATVKAQISGKEETLYVPFTFVTALMFDNENFKNVEVKNGKLIDDGDRAIVAGYAIPGLQKSLGKLAEDFDIPDYFEVSADVTNFDMKTSLTIATAGLMADLNTDEIDTKELRDASGELNDAMDQILDGTGTLADGLDKLAAGAKSASKAAGKLAKGADKVADGNKELADGLGQMKSQTSALPGGVDQLASGANALSAGLKEAVKGAKTLENGAGSLKDGLQQAKAGAQQIAGGLSALRGSAEDGSGLAGAQAVANQLANELSSAQEQLAGLSGAKEAVDAAKSLIDGCIEEIGDIPDVSEAAGDAKAQIEVLSGEENLSESGQNALEALSGDIDGIVEAADAISDLSDMKGKLEQASELLGLVSEGLSNISADSLDAAIAGAQAIADGLGAAISAIDDQLLPGTNELVKGFGDESDQQSLIGGAAALEAGASQLAGDENSGLTAASNGSDALAAGLNELASKAAALIEGVNKIVTGADKLADGSSELADGVHKFDKGLKELPDGASAAADGAGELLDGLGQFKEEGIGKITDLIDDDLLPFVDRLDALKAAANDYNNFAGITEGTTGSVKFIIETDAISSDE